MNAIDKVSQETTRHLVQCALDMLNTRHAVVQWTIEQGRLGRLVRNEQAPMWNEYTDADARYSGALTRLWHEAQPLPTTGNESQRLA